MKDPSEDVAALLQQMEDYVHERLAKRAGTPVMTREQRRAADARLEKFQRKWDDHWTSLRSRPLARFLGEVIDPDFEAIDHILGTMASVFRRHPLFSIDRSNGDLVRQGLRAILFQLAKQRIYEVKSSGSKQKWKELGLRLDAKFKQLGEWERRGRQPKLAHLSDPFARQPIVRWLEAIAADVQPARDSIVRSRRNPRNKVTRLAEELSRKHHLKGAAHDRLTTLLPSRMRPRNVALRVCAVVFKVSPDTLARALGLR